MKINEAIIEIMKAIGNVGKDSTNTSQGFQFRGIDQIVNAVSPLLQEYGVLLMPTVLASNHTVGQASTGTTMHRVQLQVKYQFVGPEGDTLESIVESEAMDSGDKATVKAMSVAFRTVLVQVFAIATGDDEPQTRENGSTRAMPKRPPDRVMTSDDPEYDPWATIPQVVTSSGHPVPNCAHGPMNHWVSPKTNKGWYFCSLDKNDPDACQAVKA